MNTHAEFNHLAAAAEAVLAEYPEGFVIGDEPSPDPEEWDDHFNMVDKLVGALKGGKEPTVWRCFPDNMAEDVTEWAMGEARKWFDERNYQLDEIPAALLDADDWREHNAEVGQYRFLATQPYR